MFAVYEMANMSLDSEEAEAADGEAEMPLVVATGRNIQGMKCVFEYLSISREMSFPSREIGRYFKKIISHRKFSWPSS